MPIFRTSSGSSAKSPPASPNSRTTLFRSPTSSSSTSPGRVHFGVPEVASLFVKMRRRSDRAKSSSPSPLSSPTTKKYKSHHIESSSGDEPLSHRAVEEGMTCQRKEEMQLTDTFICLGGVNVPMLLRATRNVLLEKAGLTGADALVDERWKCVICGPKNRPNGTFKVQITYSACATRSSHPDPHQPVALNRVKGVPGLMTILRRNDL